MTDEIIMSDETIGRIIRERPGRVRWLRYVVDGGEQILLEQEWIIEPYDTEHGIWGPPEAEWRMVPTEDAE